MPQIPLKNFSYGDDPRKTVDILNENFNLLMHIMNYGNLDAINVAEASTVINITELNLDDIYEEIEEVGLPPVKDYEFLDETNGDPIMDEFGIDTKFIKWFKNMCYNSGFELFDRDTDIPHYWTGGVSSPDSNFFNSYSMKLEKDDISQQTGQGLVNPQYYDDVSENTRISFHKKGGAVKIEVYDDDTSTAFNLTDEDGGVAASKTYVWNSNWEPAAYTVSLTHAATTNMKVKFTNVDAVLDAYVDGVIIEPDYTGKYPSAYSDGPRSNKMDYLTVGDTAPSNPVKGDVWIDTT